ncbi:MAG TPA: hypothetical protein VHC01_14280 [Gaiellaceae bacterium]|nr:hypothetical protein [Gaiellaceae bacterium]
MGALPLGLLVPIVAFRIVGLGHSIPTELDRGPCPDGRWSAALYAADAPRRIGTEYGCGLATSKRSTRTLDPASIHQRSRETFVLPGRIVKATCDARFTWTDVHRSRAAYRCTFAGGTIAGGGPALDGRANYLLRISR